MTALDTGARFDGRQMAYVPPRELRVDSSLALDQGPDVPVDPITYEVIRYGVWNINEEHGLTIQKVSGSPIAKYARDFNPCLMTDRAEYVYFGPYTTMHAGVQDLNALWIMEYVSPEDGVCEGDMFLCNDPWIGATHQSDTSVLCPVFVDGRLFCWVANTLHFADLGGPRPGGWSPNATDVYAEPVPTPPVKIVSGGKVRHDLERAWARRSRVPEMTALDLRALIAGNSVARDRVLELVAEHGARVVKSVLHKILGDSEQAFVRKVSSLPDGTWREQGYMDGAGPRDRRSYLNVLTITKSGTELVISNEGSDAATGVLNSAYSGWRAAILAVVAALMCTESLRSPGGALRHIEFQPEHGTLATANHPAAVSSGVIFASASALTLATRCMTKMMALGEETARHASTSGGIGHFPIDSLSGCDTAGSYFANAILDFNASPTGAGLSADGVDTGTPFWGPLLIAPNVEDNEQVMPILYLWRRERTDSGGAGKFIGGMGLDVAYAAIGDQPIVHQIASCGVAIPCSSGAFGGAPGASNQFILRRGSDIRDLLYHGVLPTSLDELAGESVLLEPKQSDLPQQPGEVICVRAAGGGGTGDPLRRLPSAVVADLRNGRISSAAAVDRFGVVLSSSSVGGWDDVATTAQRGRLYTDRAAAAGVAVSGIPPSGESFLPPLIRLSNDGRNTLICACCKTPLPQAKASCPVRELPLTQAGPLVADAAHWLDDAFVLREFVCPRCGLLIESEIARSSDVAEPDILLTDA